MSAKATCGHTPTAIAKIAGGVRWVNARRSSLLMLFALALATNVSAQDVPCTCRYKGEDFGLGHSICLNGPDGLKVATCSMVLNNTSWQFSNAPCPVTLLDKQENPAQRQTSTYETSARQASASLAAAAR